MKRLDGDLFATIVANTPLVSIDLVIRNENDKILLGKRNNRPAQGMWFVPGGIVRKDESIHNAFVRLTQAELSTGLFYPEARFLGVYEHFYPDNFSGEAFTTHYVVLAYEIVCHLDLESLPLDQHGAYRWWALGDLLACENVHEHSKWYFNSAKGVQT